MISKGLKCGLALSCGLLAVPANAATPEKRVERPFADADHAICSLPRGSARLPFKSLVVNHGGRVIAQPKVVFIFWGPTFSNAASADHTIAVTLQAYRNQLGRTPEWAAIRPYGVFPTDLGTGTPDWFDTSTPPTNVTDSSVRAEVNRYFSGGHGAYNSSTIYEVLLPRTSYSSSGSSTSCGGPRLAYCAYHGNYSGAGTVIYAVVPFPSCSGCQVSGWSDVQNLERLVFQVTANAVTDPVNGGWWDGVTGEEVADKCAWSPTPFIGTNGYAYQYIWSNADNACIK